MGAVGVHPADPAAPERCLAETAATLKVVAILAPVSVFPKMVPDLLCPEKMPVVASKPAEEKAADDPHRASAGGRWTVGQFMHYSESTLA